MEDIFCLFCGRSIEEVGDIFSGEVGGNICDLCVQQIYQVIHKEEQNSDLPKPLIDWQSIKPTTIKKYLDEYVIGQDQAKKTLAVAVYNHYKRLAQDHQNDGVTIEKSNILMIGSTGTGKTYLVRTLAKKLKVPFCMVDATSLTEAGYVGEDVESMLTRLLHIANYDVKTAERGIIYIDEFDKIARKAENTSITRDVSGEGVQQAMLKLMEGSIINVPPKGGRKHPEQKMVAINTENILFICGGSFDGMEKIIERRLQTRPIGFQLHEADSTIQNNTPLSHLSSTDLKAYGFIPELVGRLSAITYLQPLNQQALHNILTQPKNALIKQYKKLFKMDNITLHFTEECLKYIVEKAFKLKLGARGLRTLCESIMRHAMFELPSQKALTNYTISKDYATQCLEQKTFTTSQVA